MKTFILKHFYRFSQEQSQPLQHQNSATAPDIRPNLEENVNQSKQFSKPYTIQMKQYPAVESLSNSSPSTSLNSENEKRNSQQQVKLPLCFVRNRYRIVHIEDTPSLMCTVCSVVAPKISGEFSKC